MKSSAFVLPTDRPVPATRPDGPLRAFHTMVAQQAREQPDALALVTALVTGQDVWSYRQLDEFANRVAAALQRDGCVAQGSVAICAANSNAYMGVWIGAQRAGLAIAPLAPSSTVAQLMGMVTDAAATHFFIDAAVAASLAAATGSTASAARQIRLDDSDVSTGLTAWLAPRGSTPLAVEIQADWAFNIIYSSGTTGTPKGIVHLNTYRWEQAWRATTYGPHSVTLIATPLYSNTTLVAVLPALAHGGQVVLMPKFDAEKYLQLAQQHRATHTMLVPVQYQRLMALPTFDDYDLLSFKFKSSTSAPFAADLKADILARWPGALIEYYGMTEGGASCVLFAHLTPHKLHTVGQPALGHEVRLIDEAGNELPQGETGEVVGRSSVMMSGYHNQPGKTSEAEWFDADGRRFIRHGDVARFDEDGFLILMDRRKDMIISGGFNVFPSDLEAEIKRHPGVAEVAVVGVPSTQWGETPVAYVVRRIDVTVTAEELRTLVNAGLGKTQRIADLRFIAELPRSAIGKVLKRELRDAYQQEQQSR